MPLRTTTPRSLPFAFAFAFALAPFGVARSKATVAPCPATKDIHGSKTLPQRDSEERLSFIRNRVEVGADRSRAWALGWGVSLAALTVGQLAIIPVIPKGERVDFYAGAVASGVGALTRAVFIPRVILHRRRLRRAAAEGDVCTRVQEAETELSRDAKWERQGRHLLMHGLNLGFNAAVGLVVGIAFDRPVAGNRLASLGAVVGEIMIITQPTFMSRSLEDYRRGNLRPAPRWRPAPLVLRGGGGLSLRGRI